MAEKKRKKYTRMTNKAEEALSKAPHLKIIEN
jgi:hypothetical protein